MEDLAAFPVSGATLLGQNDLFGSVLDHVAALNNNADLTGVLSTIRTTAGRGALKVGIEKLSNLGDELGGSSSASSDSSHFLSSASGAALGVSNLFSQPHYRKHSAPSTSGHEKAAPVYHDSSAQDPLTGAAEGAALVGGGDVKINFQPNTSTVPTGYTKDIGEAYSDTRGYGWVQEGTNTPRDITLYARDRNRAGIDPRLNTLLHMQSRNTPAAAWEYALPDGTYNVTVSAGDQPSSSSVYDSQNTINVEGVSAINRFQGNATQEYQQASVQANVSDGRLTIDAIGGSNTKINYIDIASVTSPPSSGFTQINWSPAAPSPLKRGEALGGVVNGKLYVLGGYLNNPFRVLDTVDVYNPADNMWTQITKPMPKPLSHAGTEVDGNNIYLAGGYIGKPGGGQTFATKDVWKYNVNTNEWTPMTSLPQARGGGGLALLGRELHFFGGSDIKRADKGTHWALNLDDPTPSWDLKAPLLNPRNHIGDATLGGKIYALGGQRGQDAASVTQTSVHSWDPATNTWTEVAGLPLARGHISGATFVMDGRIIVAGGEPKHGVRTANVTAYDPMSNVWTELTPLPAPRKSGVAGSIGGQIFFATGYESTTFKGAPAN